MARISSRTSRDQGGQQIRGRVGRVWVRVSGQGGWNGPRMVAWAAEPWAAAVLALGQQDGHQDDVAAALLDLERGASFFPAGAAAGKAGNQ